MYQGRNRVDTPCQRQKIKPCCCAKFRVNHAVSTECGRVSRVLPTVPTTPDVPAFSSQLCRFPATCQPCRTSPANFNTRARSFVQAMSFFVSALGGACQLCHLQQVDLFGLANHAV